MTTKRYHIKKIEDQPYAEWTWKGVSQLNRCDVCGTDGMASPLRVLRARMHHPATLRTVPQPDRVLCSSDYIRFLGVIGRPHQQLVAGWCRARDAAA